MTAKKTPSTPTSKSTELTDATKPKESTLNPDFIMKTDNSINSIPTVNSDNAVNSETTTHRQATAQIGLLRVQGYISRAVKAGEASSGQHRGKRMGKD